MKLRGRGPDRHAAAVPTGPVWQPTEPVWHPRAWTVWALSPWLAAFVVGVVALDVAGLGFAVTRPLGTRYDLALFALLVACDVGGLELTRRAGEKVGISRDMHALWELPVALLLPLVYAPIIPIIRLALTQWRVRHGCLHRRVFSACALGISYLAAALVFRFAGIHLAGLPTASAAGRGAGLTAGLTADPFRHGLAWMLTAAAAGVVQRLVNGALVFTAARGADPSIRLREAQFSREPMYNDLTELCLAVLVAFGVASTPIALLFAFPFAALPLRAVRHAQLVTDARTDSKTGLLNARAWHEEAATELGRAVHADQPLAVALLDLDWFKHVNDTYGHLFGDEVLGQIGQCLPGALRAYDLAGRFGGEEFVLLLPRTRAVDAIRVADRVRGRIADLPLSAPGGEAVQVTASVGVAALEGGSRRDLKELMAAADAALYRAKRGGRNQVQMLSPSRGLSATGGPGGASQAAGSSQATGEATGQATGQASQATAGTGQVTGANPFAGLARQILPIQPTSPEVGSRGR
jgi:diguanylate cyclase (GGDEF)-like protein